MLASLLIGLSGLLWCLRKDAAIGLEGLDVDAKAERRRSMD